MLWGNQLWEFYFGSSWLFQPDHLVILYPAPEVPDVHGHICSSQGYYMVCIEEYKHRGCGGTVIHSDSPLSFFSQHLQEVGENQGSPHHVSDRALPQSLGSRERATLPSTFLLCKLPKAGSQHKQKHLLVSSRMSATYIGWEQWKKSSLALVHIYPGYHRYPRTPKEMSGYSSSVAALLAQLCNRIYLNASNFFVFVSRCRWPKQRVENQIFIAKK